MKKGSLARGGSTDRRRRGCICPSTWQDMGSVILCDHWAQVCWPKRSGAIYVHLTRMSEMRPAFLGRGRLDPRGLGRGYGTYNDAPMKFEAGTPGIVQTIGLGVALDWMMDVGMDNIAAHEAVACRLAADAACRAWNWCCRCRAMHLIKGVNFQLYSGDGLCGGDAHGHRSDRAG